MQEGRPRKWQLDVQQCMWLVQAELLRAQVRELERRRAEDDKRKAALEALAAEKTRLEQEKVDKTRWESSRG